MIAPETGPDKGVTAFRRRLLAGMVFVIVALTAGGLYLAERTVSAETQHAFHRAFASELELMRTVREIRHASIEERCRALVRKPRIHAALEDNALDMLYPSAGDELGDVLADKEPPGEPFARHSIHARFYRFLDAQGKVLPAANAPAVGVMQATEERRLAFAILPREEQDGYLWRQGESAAGEVVELIVTPILSTENGEAISALVAGFPMSGEKHRSAGMQSGIWLEDRLHMPTLADPVRAVVGTEVARAIARGTGAAAQGIPVRAGAAEHLVFFERLNPGSLFPAAYQVGVYPLAALHAQQFQLRWKAAAAGLALLMLGIAASFYISARLAVPVRELAVVSEENRVLRERAESALKVTSEELQRTARFSADASHQLKTPVAVMRAGLDELLAREDLSTSVRDELSLLVHQTFRITSIIEDLLLLSRLDSGRLQPELSPVDLTHVVDTCVDDLHLLNDSMDLEVELDVPSPLRISGEKRYTMLIVQNLVENAHKYNLPNGRIRISAREEEGMVVLRVGNNAHPIPAGSREHIFERFHRAAVGENVPGHGLGLNVARELARLHGGDLRLVRSDGEWTEFEATFRPAHPAAAIHATA
ncbi:MAG: HAMP domain-containing sensor histidine kinase [Chthoniobacteraceae bacterium]